MRATKTVKKLSIKIKSAVLNALVAVIGALSFSLTILENSEFPISVILAIAFISTLLFGWLFSNWYKITPGEKFQLKPYIATTVISFPSALLSGVLFMGMGIFISSGSINISVVFTTGIVGGLIAAVFTLPISLLFGVALGWYLVNGQKL